MTAVTVDVPAQNHDEKKLEISIINNVLISRSNMFISNKLSVNMIMTVLHLYRLFNSPLPFQKDSRVTDIGMKSEEPEYSNS